MKTYFVHITKNQKVNRENALEMLNCACMLLHAYDVRRICCKVSSYRVASQLCLLLSHSNTPTEYQK